MTDKQRRQEMKRFPKWKELLEARQEFKAKMIANATQTQSKKNKVNP